MGDVWLASSTFSWEKGDDRKMTVNTWKLYNHVNCGWRNEYGSGPWSYEHYLEWIKKSSLLRSSLVAWYFLSTI